MQEIVNLENILKHKTHSRDGQVLKQHKEAMEKAEALSKINKEIEQRIEGFQYVIEKDSNSIQELQETFSHKYFALNKKI